MPKKFKGENSKATAARDRKATKAAEEKEAKNRAIEDALWKDDDKTVSRKNNRKEEKDRKHQEMLARKQEAQKLLEEEEAKMTPARSTAPAKLTQFQIQEQKKAAALAEAKGSSNVVETHLDAPLMENTNKMEEIISASGIDDAVKALSLDSKPTVKEGGRVKINMAAAYKKYEEGRLPSMKKENPTLKHSQILQRIKKEWQKSPENPLNQLQL